MTEVYMSQIISREVSTVLTCVAAWEDHMTYCSPFSIKWERITVLSSYKTNWCIFRFFFVRIRRASFSTSGRLRNGVEPLGQGHTKNLFLDTLGQISCVLHNREDVFLKERRLFTAVAMNHKQFLVSSYCQPTNLTATTHLKCWHLNSDYSEIGYSLFIYYYVEKY